MSFFSTHLFSVALGGGLGAVLRYALNLGFAKFQFLPLGTLIANLLASFFICFLFGMVIENFDFMLSNYYSFISIGLLGALSTYSTFAFDLVSLVKNKSVGRALVYALISIFGASLVGLLGFILPFMVY